MPAHPCRTDANPPGRCGLQSITAAPQLTFAGFCLDRQSLPMEFPQAGRFCAAEGSQGRHNDQGFAWECRDLRQLLLAGLWQSGISTSQTA